MRRAPHFTHPHASRHDLGEGQRGIDVVGPRIGGLQVVVSPDRTTQLTHVENCADAFVAALECRSPIRVFNVEDGFAITAADFAQTLMTMGRTLAVPAWATAAALAPIGPVSRWACRRGLPVPGLLIPERVAARFNGVTVDANRLRSELELDTRSTIPAMPSDFLGLVECPRPTLLPSRRAS